MSSRQRAREQRAQKRRAAQVRLIAGVSIGAIILLAAIVLLTITAEPDTLEVDSDFYEGLTQSVDSSGATAYAVGASDAPVTVVEYADFSCSHCRDLAPVMHRLIDSHVRTGQVRIIFKIATFIYPDYSRPAGQAAYCAGEQGKFWEMQDAIWATYDRTGSPAGYSRAAFERAAGGLGLDLGTFQSCYGSAQTSAVLDEIDAERLNLGITGTPTVLVNGQSIPFTGPEQYYDDLVAAIGQ